MKPRLPIALATLALLAAAPHAATGSIRERIYPAPTAPLTLAGTPPGSELVTVTTSDGLALKGAALPARDGRPTLLVFHGNASTATGTLAWLAPLAAKGYGIVAAEYRGYSANPGTPDEAGLATDAEAFYALARARAGAGPLIVVGHSLGGGVAFGLAGRHRLDALVTIATFTSLRAMAPKIARAFVPDAYRNEAAAPGLDEPWFLIHGLRDQTVPASHGNALHAAATRAHREGASLVLLNADHRPDGESIAAAIEIVRTKLTTGSYAGITLPADMKLVPFGASAPVVP